MPVDDLVNIYTELYGHSTNVTSDVVSNCTLLLYLQRSVKLSLSPIGLSLANDTIRYLKPRFHYAIVKAGMAHSMCGQTCMGSR